MCFALVRAAVHGLPSLFISLDLNEMVGDIKVMLQANKVFKAPRVPVQGAAGWGEDTKGPREEGKVIGRLKGEVSVCSMTYCIPT